jgi:hypothetical protein
MTSFEKYLKYKTKYLNLIKQIGGVKYRVIKKSGESSPDFETDDIQEQFRTQIKPDVTEITIIKGSFVYIINLTTKEIFLKQSSGENRLLSATLRIDDDTPSAGVSLRATTGPTYDSRATAEPTNDSRATARPSVGSGAGSSVGSGAGSSVGSGSGIGSGAGSGDRPDDIIRGSFSQYSSELKTIVDPKTRIPHSNLQPQSACTNIIVNSANTILSLHNQGNKLSSDNIDQIIKEGVLLQGQDPSHAFLDDTVGKLIKSPKIFDTGYPMAEYISGSLKFNFRAIIASIYSTPRINPNTYIAIPFTSMGMTLLIILPPANYYTNPQYFYSVFNSHAAAGQAGIDGTQSYIAYFNDQSKFINFLEQLIVPIDGNQLSMSGEYYVIQNNDPVSAAPTSSGLGSGVSTAPTRSGYGSGVSVATTTPHVPSILRARDVLPVSTPSMLQVTCSNCTADNDYNSDRCKVCDAPSTHFTNKTAPQKVTLSVRKPVCPVCTYENELGKTKCEICESPLFK